MKLIDLVKRLSEEYEVEIWVEKNGKCTVYGVDEIDDLAQERWFAVVKSGEDGLVIDKGKYVLFSPPRRFLGRKRGLGKVVEILKEHGLKEGCVYDDFPLNEA